MKYDLVLVKLDYDRPYLYMAPQYSMLREGDEVEVPKKSPYDDTVVYVRGIVVELCEFDANYEVDFVTKELLMKATATEEPIPKVRAKFTEEVFEYDDSTGD